MIGEETGGHLIHVDIDPVPGGQLVDGSCWELADFEHPLHEKELLLLAVNA